MARACCRDAVQGSVGFRSSARTTSSLPGRGHPVRGNGRGHRADRARPAGHSGESLASSGQSLAPFFCGSAESPAIPFVLSAFGSPRPDLSVIPTRRRRRRGATAKVNSKSRGIDTTRRECTFRHNMLPAGTRAQGAGRLHVAPAAGCLAGRGRMRISMCTSTSSPVTATAAGSAGSRTGGWTTSVGRVHSEICRGTPAGRSRVSMADWPATTIMANLLHQACRSAGAPRNGLSLTKCGWRSDRPT